MNMQNANDAKLISLVAAIRETASRMEGLSMQMQDFAGEQEIQAHGVEVADAALIAETWAIGIERDRGLRPSDEIADVTPLATHAMGVHMGGLGDKVMNFIIESRLLSTECPACPDEGTLTVWSANAAEQIEAFIAGLACQGTVPCPLCGQSQIDGDIETIRKAKELYKRLRGYYPDSLDVFEEMIKSGESSALPCAEADLGPWRSRFLQTGEAVKLEPMTIPSWILGFATGCGLVFGIAGEGWSMLVMGILATAITSVLDAYVKRRWPELEDQP